MTDENNQGTTIIYLDAAAKDQVSAKSQGTAKSDLLILSPRTPLHSARELIRQNYTVHGGRTVHHHVTTFYRWTGTSYVEAAKEEVRSATYTFLDGAYCLGPKNQLIQFNPNRHSVGDVLEAIAAECTTLYRAWVDWCHTNGIEHAGPSNAFSKDLHAALPEVETTNPLRRDGNRIRYYRGLDLDPEKAPRSSL